MQRSNYSGIGDRSEVNDYNRERVKTEIENIVVVEIGNIFIDHEKDVNRKNSSNKRVDKDFADDETVLTLYSQYSEKWGFFLI